MLLCVLLLLLLLGGCVAAAYLGAVWAAGLQHSGAGLCLDAAVEVRGVGCMKVADSTEQLRVSHGSLADAAAVLVV
jgi:hypothetical protein